MEWTEVRNITLWHSSAFQADGWETYRNITLARKGLLHVRDLMLNGATDQEGIKLLAPSWQKLYRAVIKWLLKQQSKTTQAVALKWKLRAVAAAVAATREPEARQTAEVWKALKRAKLPRKVKESTRQVLSKKLPVGKWMESIGMGDTDKCPLCLRVEDNEHRFKQCPYLEVPMQLTRDPYLPIKDQQGRRIEQSRICLENQQKSLKQNKAS